MTTSEARHIAQLYTSEMGEVLPGFMFGLGDIEEFTDKYYFDFIWLTLSGQVPEKPPVAGGARGLTVNKKDKQVQLTTHGDYATLEDRENKLIETYQLLSDFKNKKENLPVIKTKFNLTSKQLVEFYRIIKDTELDPKKIFETLNEMLYNLKNNR